MDQAVVLPPQEEFCGGTEHLKVPVQSLFVWTEKKKGGGEDAEPLVECSVMGDNGLLGVLDGLGGAGSSIYRTGDGKCHTSAYFASRFVGQVVVEHFRQPGASINGVKFTPDDLPELKKKIADALTSRLGELEMTPSKLKSSLIQKLPTTLAALCWSVQAKECYCNVVWAGDSRGYLLTPEVGLQQLSRDDSRGSGDAFEELTQDAPLSNYIRADNSFVLNHWSVSVHLPLIVFVATDGCFGYLYTPAHFEKLLLSALLEAESMEDWKEKIQAQLEPVAADDASLALAALGWKDFEELKRDFQERLTHLKELLGPADQVVAELAQVESKLQKMRDHKEELLTQKKAECLKVWTKYRPDYEGKLGP